MGYNAGEAHDFLTDLGDAGRSLYLWRQIPLDALYPAALALTLVRLFARSRKSANDQRLIRLGQVIALSAALADYSENAGIVAMLLTWPTFWPALALATGGTTIAKSALTTLAVLLALVSVTRRFFRASPRSAPFLREDVLQDLVPLDPAAAN